MRVIYPLAIKPFLTTKLMMGFSAFLAEKWYLVIGTVLGLTVLSLIVFKTAPGKRILDGLALRTPLVSPVIKKINIVRIVRALETNSLESVSGSLGSTYYREAAAMVLEGMKRGERVSQALKNYPGLFPSTVVQMIEVGEEAGGMANILKKLGGFFEAEAAQAVRKLIITVELAFMLIMGGIIGFLLVSLLQPIL